MKSVEEMMLPPPPSSPYWKAREEKRRMDNRTSSTGISSSPFRDSLARRERKYQQERQRMSLSTDYKAELGRLLSKAKGTPYEETLQKLIEGRRGGVSISESLVENSDDHETVDSFTMENSRYVGLPPRSPPRAEDGSQSRFTEVDQSKEAQVPLVARDSPTIKTAKSIIDMISSKRDESLKHAVRLRDTETAIRSRKSIDKMKWLDDMAKPKKRYGWSYESEFRKKNSLIKTTTNHLGRQRPPPEVRSVDMVAHTARGSVNLLDYHESMKDFVKLGAVKSDMYDPNQHLVQNLAKKKKVISKGDFQTWLEDTRQWRERITEKVEHKSKEQAPTFAPTMFTHDNNIILRARERESHHIEEEMLEMSSGIEGKHKKVRARSASPSLRGDPGTGTHTGTHTRTEVGAPSIKTMKERQNDLRAQRERFMNEEEGTWIGGPEESDDEFVVSPSPPKGDSSSLAYNSPDTHDAFDREEEEKLRHYREVAEKIATTPDVFKRMSARIEAYNQRAKAEKDLQAAVENDIKNAVHNSQERMRLLELRERRRRSKSPTLTESRRGRAEANGSDLSFTPKINSKSASIVKRMQEEGVWTSVVERRSKRSRSLPTRIDKTSQTAQERVLSFLDSLGGESPASSPRVSIEVQEPIGSNNQDEDKQSPRGRPKRRKTFVFEKSLRSGNAEMRPTSLPPPPDRPRFGVRSISSEALIDRYDTIETKARRAQKREQRVLESRERSKSPKLLGSRVNINSRRYTMASPPRSSRFSQNPGRFSDKSISKLDNITRRLSVLYERRESLEKGGDSESVFSRSRAGDSSDDDENMVRVGRRKSVTANMNKKHIARSRFRGQSFEERVETSVDEYITRRGVSDALALRGASPGPGHYNISGETKSYFSNCNKLVGGEAVDYRTTGGKYGYKFGNRSMRKMSYYGQVEVKGVAYKLTDDQNVVGLPSAKSSGDRLPDGIHEENAPRSFSPGRTFFGDSTNLLSKGE